MRRYILSTHRQVYDLGYGFAQVSIVPFDAEMAANSNIPLRDRGKAPGIPSLDGWHGYDWPHKRPQLADIAVLDAHGAGVGLATSHSLFVIDADIVNRALARKIRAVIRKFLGGKLPPTRIGQSPKASYFFRIEHQVSSGSITFDDGNLLRGKIELLGVGRQSVVAAIHNVTGKPYWWPVPLPPYAELPILEWYQVSILVRLLCEALPNPKTKWLGLGSDRDAGDQARVFANPDQVRRAISLIPNDENCADRAVFIEMGFACKAALGEVDGLEAFQEWCQRWTGGHNDPRYVEQTFNSLHGPFRVGASYLYEQAELYGPPGAFSKADAVGNDIVEQFFDPQIAAQAALWEEMQELRAARETAAAISRAEAAAAAAPTAEALYEAAEGAKDGHGGNGAEPSGGHGGNGAEPPPGHSGNGAEPPSDSIDPDAEWIAKRVKTLLYQPDFTDFPEDKIWANIDGLAGDIMRLTIDTAKYPVLLHAMSTALCTVSILAARKVYTLTEPTGVQLYYLNLARTGAGKQHPMDVQITIVKLCVGYTLHAGWRSSIQMLAELIVDRPAVAICQDEVSEKLLSLKGGGNTISAVSQLRDEFRKLWGAGPDTPYLPDTGRKDKNRYREVHHPCFILYGMGTENVYIETLDSKSIADGTLNRMLPLPRFAKVERAIPKQGRLIVPDSIIERGRELFQCNYFQIANGPEIDRGLIFVPFDAEAAACNARNIKLQDALTETKPTTRGIAVGDLFARYAEMVKRIGLILAVSRSPENVIKAVITGRDMMFASDLVGWALAQQVIYVKRLMTENAPQKNYKMVKEIIRKAGTMTKSELTRALDGKLKAFEYKDVLEQLVDSGAIMIKVTPASESSGGRPKTEYKYLGWGDFD